MVVRGTGIKDLLINVLSSGSGREESADRMLMLQCGKSMTKSVILKGQHHMSIVSKTPATDQLLYN